MCAHTVARRYKAVAISFVYYGTFRTAFGFTCLQRDVFGCEMFHQERELLSSSVPHLACGRSGGSLGAAMLNSECMRGAWPRAEASLARTTLVALVDARRSPGGPSLSSESCWPAASPARGSGERGLARGPEVPLRLSAEPRWQLERQDGTSRSNGP